MSQEGKATTAPATQDPPSLLQPGSLVEVNPRDNDYLGAWYLAVIVERATSTCDDRYVVQLLFLYEDISTGTKAIREYNSVDIRPLPPRHRPRKFKVGDLVEAYYRFGWFEGEIVEELHNGNYICQLKSSKRLELVVERLRLQRSWRDGEWIPPLDESELAVEEEDSTDETKQTDSNTAGIMESEADSAESSTAGTGNIQEASGQGYGNYIKSEIFFSKFGKAKNKKWITGILGVHCTDRPGKYLGCQSGMITRLLDVEKHIEGVRYMPSWLRYTDMDMSKCIHINGNIMALSQYPNQQDWGNGNNRFKISNIPT
ncbi:hypothetical protein GOBAR_DD05268 [Gossypium barbadense]|nr:hypothetical protein GOBAR_DD05268 [Gossypium barbadense]